MTPSQKQAMLDAHNKERSEVQPQAANMEYQIWSDDLANLAQMWTNKCIWAHGFLKFGPNYPNQPKVATKEEQIGQNLAREYGETTSPEDRVTKWGMEKQAYRYSKHPPNCVPKKMCTHYTQVAWARSKYVGCGMKLCKRLGSGYQTKSGQTFVGCDYSPGGNMQGDYPYKLGTPCSKCASGYGWCYKNLCRYCADYSPQCGESGLTKDMCSSDKEKMAKFCPKMCNLCECPLKCQRGKLSLSTCTCKCPPGYRPPDCSEKCEDFSEYNCKKYIKGGQRCDLPYMQEKCPKTCGICDDGSGTTVKPPEPGPETIIVVPEVERPPPIPAPPPPPPPPPPPEPEPVPQGPPPPTEPVPSGPIGHNEHSISYTSRISASCVFDSVNVSCSTQYRALLKKTGRPTTNKCEDILETCPEMALRNACSKNPDKMLTKCRRSCGLCKVYDKEKWCPAWGAQGYCTQEKHWAWMLNNCPQSCDLPLSGHQFCATRPDGRYPTPVSCKGFVQCTTGWTKYQACPQGKSFDKDSNSCRLAENVLCENPAPGSVYDYDIKREVQQKAPTSKSEYTKTSLNSTQMQNMLDEHNKYRSMVQPQAANMEYQVWSDDLASLAQMWVNKCIWGHGYISFGSEYPNDPTVATRDEQIGQNLAREYGKTDTPEARVEKWYGESQHYTYSKYDSPMSPNQCKPGKMCGHYTQLVWALSQDIGCGMKWCKTMTGTSSPPEGQTFVACDYAAGYVLSLPGDFSSSGRLTLYFCM
ncbi:Cysteine-rich secretory protein LCCL domain-containing 2 [Exaiptasia diaphana]|nr:Cysteine-rich secretory protein LCCL domain-containing 2 [Exaiptasia diaphana]